jgi:outer membrane immunogenic protein
MRKMVFASAVFALLVGAPALGADLPVKAPVVPPPIFTWTGFYVGGNAGYSWGRASTDLTEILTTTATITTVAGTPVASATVTTPSFGHDRARLDGALAGIQAGYNWQFNKWVLGLEGDAQWTDQRGGLTICPVPPGTAPVPCPGATGTQFGAADYRLAWFGTLRGRAGVTFDRVLLYATGGLAVGEIKGSYVDGFVNPAAFNPFAAGSFNTTRAGWVVGAGAEAALGRNWSIKAEYLHMDFGNVDQGISANGVPLSLTIGAFITTLSQSVTSSFHAHVTDDVFRVGVNYRFGAPVIAAKY